MKLLLVGFLAVSSVAIALQPKPTVLKEEQNGSSVTLKKGEKFVVALKTNPTTGYQLHMISRGDEPWTLVSQQYRQDPTTGPATGVGGVELFEFKAKKSGSARLTFASLRTFDMKGTLRAAEPWQVSITVK